jgi:predicted acylesterase/phospholipase RssA
MALSILRKAEDLTETTNQETLGIAGSIFKQKWELDNQIQHLSRSLHYYQRGYERGIEGDQGYTAINTAYVLSLLAYLEIKESRNNRSKKCEGTGGEKNPPGADVEGGRAGAGNDAARPVKFQAGNNGLPETAMERLAMARRIREEIVDTLPDLPRKDGFGWLEKEWWFYSTVGEALFGLGYYQEAAQWFDRWYCQKLELHEWEYEATARQLTSLTRLQIELNRWIAEGTKSGEALGANEEERRKKREEMAEAEKEMAERALKSLLGVDGDMAQSLFKGKFGLALSGGGFRASLFHIGVLARLAELDMLRHVQVLSCVSGGSIVGAYYYLEVRNLLRTKADRDIKRKDYIDLVKRIEEGFLRGVQRNIRTRVIAEFTTNLKMLFWPNYSRTMRAGELYERELYSRIDDEEGQQDRWINDLFIQPKDESNDFRPQDHNWRRHAKVPVLIINATTLNTGHSWHFTASYMGEPPAGIDSNIDGNDRLRRMYYAEAPVEFRRYRLGYAVAASACVPGLFEPVMLKGLYPDRIVRLVDGGVCDNQGVTGLLEQDCNVILVSDGSGHMESEADSSANPFRSLKRSNSISMARVREAQYHELAARRRSGLLRGLLFIHLKQDLDVDPIDWLDCPTRLMLPTWRDRPTAKAVGRATA